METSTTESNPNPNHLKTPSTTKSGYDSPWIERYRPHNLSSIVGNEETILRLRSIAQDGNMPNLILCGPPGTGKTTSVHALARELLGNAYSNGVLELNASDARGIDVVRNKIKGFAMNKVTLPPGRYVEINMRIEFYVVYIIHNSINNNIIIILMSLIIIFLSFSLYCDYLKTQNYHP